MKRTLARMLPEAIVLIGGLAAVNHASADHVRMKNDLVYQGVVHRDDTMVAITDGLKRTILRDTKVAKFESDPGLRNLEAFQLEQPIEIRTGATAMPSVVLGVIAAPWDEYGQRSYSYLNAKMRPVKLTQAIVEMTPHLVKVRGLNAAWLSSLALNQVPRPVVLGLLGRVDQTSENERRRVCQFLIQAEWYAEARTELDRLAIDFPNAADAARAARQTVRELEAAKTLREVDQAVLAQQPRAALLKLKGVPTEEVDPQLAADVRARVRQFEDNGVAIRQLAEELRKKVAALAGDQGELWSNRLIEVLQVVKEAPDVARTRLDTFARSLDDQAATDDQRLALAFSGWRIGPEQAVPNIETADAYWRIADTLRLYLASRPDEDRSNLLAQLQSITWPKVQGNEEGRLDPELATKLLNLMPPPRPQDREVTPGEPRTVRVLDDPNPEPTEYVVLLPPEYHPSRVYPVIVALHSGKGPRSAIEFWGGEAGRRGYIVIAPDFLIPSPTPDYRYTATENAAVTLALRDARKRFSIDSDRVCLVGQLLGGNMAWDHGLAHPDTYAAVATINGIPAKYVGTTRANGKLVPFYEVLGELVPAGNEVIFPFAKEQINKNYEFTHVEYLKRGLEELPEELPAVFDWLGKWKRSPAPKAFKAYATRPSDDRYFGVVLKELQPGRTIEPEAVEPLGKNVPKPISIEVTTSTPANLIQVKTDGVKRLEYWVSPEMLDFSKSMEVRINGKSAFKRVVRPDLETFLEDLRVRGDRQQPYWLKVVVR